MLRKLYRLIPISLFAVLVGCATQSGTGANSHEISANTPKVPLVEPAQEAMAEQPLQEQNLSNAQMPNGQPVLTPPTHVYTAGGAQPYSAPTYTVSAQPPSTFGSYSANAGSSSVGSDAATNSTAPQNDVSGFEQGVMSRTNK
jgi:hypothetical protein